MRSCDPNTINLGPESHSQKINRRVYFMLFGAAVAAGSFFLLLTKDPQPSNQAPQQTALSMRSNSLKTQNHSCAKSLVAGES
jgi:hypothetical protein